MNSRIWSWLEIVPMLIYLVACVACSTYFLFSFLGLYVQTADISAATALFY